MRRGENGKCVWGEGRSRFIYIFIWRKQELMTMRPSRFERVWRSHFGVRWPENNKKRKAASANRAARNALCIRSTVLNFSSSARPDRLKTAASAMWERSFWCLLVFSLGQMLAVAWKLRVHASLERCNRNLLVFLKQLQLETAACVVAVRAVMESLDELLHVTSAAAVRPSRPRLAGNNCMLKFASVFRDCASGYCISRVPRTCCDRVHYALVEPRGWRGVLLALSCSNGRSLDLVCVRFSREASAVRKRS